jgi:hypothetical protein
LPFQAVWRDSVQDGRVGLNEGCPELCDKVLSTDRVGTLLGHTLHYRGGTGDSHNKSCWSASARCGVLIIFGGAARLGQFPSLGALEADTISVYGLRDTSTARFVAVDGGYRGCD